MNVTKITIGRLYNLGSYEHVRYEISVEVRDGESAKDAMLGVEKILTALAPESKCCVQSQGEIEREKHRVDGMFLDLQLPDEEFRRKHGHFVGSPLEYATRCKESWMNNRIKRENYEARAAKARELLDSLGGAAVWKDAKLDWETDDCDQ